MKIIKVIVDELPWACEECQFQTYNGECALQDYELIDKEEGRPVWCPLIITEDLLKQVASPFSKWEESEEK